MLFLTKKSFLITVAMGALFSQQAQAYTLPWLQDPWGTQDKALEGRMAHLKPTNCPPPPDTSKALNLTETVIAALCNNPNTKAAYLTLLANAATYGLSYADYMPIVTGEIGRDYEIRHTPAGRDPSHLDGSGITASMTIFDFGKREASLDSAEQTLIAAGMNYDATLQQMIAVSIQNYYQLLTAQNAVNAAKETQSFAQASYEAAQLRHQVGQAALADELQAKGTYSQSLLGVQQSKNQLLQAQSILAIMLGLPADTPLSVADVDDAALTLSPFNGKVQELITKAKEKRVDLAARRSQLKSSESAMEATKRSNLPIFSTTLGHRYESLDPFHNDVRSQAIGVSLSIPIFTGFTQTYNERVAEENVKAQKQLLEQSELEVQQDVFNSWNNYETAKQSWDTSVDLLASATELRDVALGRYKEGLGTILDVLNAQSQYSNALQSHLQARYNLLNSRVELVRATGLLNLQTMNPQTVIDPPAAPINPDPLPLQPPPAPSEEPAPIEPIPAEPAPVIDDQKTNTPPPTP
ncbi:MAG: TolC family protein [Rickettsiales bacterium]|nr:TolC family protein [Rickettsiales bacterium]